MNKLQNAVLEELNKMVFGNDISKYRGISNWFDCRKETTRDRLKRKCEKYRIDFNKIEEGLLYENKSK